MTIAQFCAFSGMSRPQVRKLCDKGRFEVQHLGDFEARKEGDWKTAPIIIHPIDGFNRRGQESVNAASLKERKLLAQTMEMELKLRSRIEQIETDYEAEIIETLITALHPLKDAFDKCKLNQQQTSIIKTAFNESLQRLKKSSRK